MYMRNVIYKMLTGCYMVVALLLVGACSDNVDIQQSYPFSIETMPVPKKLKVGETAEIRCQLHRDGRYEETKYFIRYFQPDGAGTLKMSDYCRMTSTRFQVKHSGFTILPHRPTSKR